MVASAWARMMPGLASSPPQLPEWWPPSRRSTTRSMLNAPRVPRNTVGWPGCRRGPSEAMSTSAFSSVLVLRAELLQSGRADFLSRLYEYFQVEPQHPSRGNRRRHGAKVDRMLALVVGGAAAVEPVALALQLPGIEPGLPACILAADHVAVAIGKNRDERWVFDALGDQERTVLGRPDCRRSGSGTPGARSWAASRRRDSA